MSPTASDLRIPWRRFAQQSIVLRTEQGAHHELHHLQPVRALELVGAAATSTSAASAAYIHWCCVVATAVLRRGPTSHHVRPRTPLLSAYGPSQPHSAYRYVKMRISSPQVRLSVKPSVTCFKLFGVAAAAAGGFPTRVPWLVPHSITNILYGNVWTRRAYWYSLVALPECMSTCRIARDCRISYHGSYIAVSSLLSCSRRT